MQNFHRNHWSSYFYAPLPVFGVTHEVLLNHLICRRSPHARWSGVMCRLNPAFITYPFLQRASDDNKNELWRLSVHLSVQVSDFTPCDRRRHSVQIFSRLASAARRRDNHGIVHSAATAAAAEGTEGTRETASGGGRRRSPNDPPVAPNNRLRRWRSSSPRRRQ